MGENAMQDAARSKELTIHAEGDRRRSTLWGLTAAAGLLIFYFGILGLAESAAHAWQTFANLWYWFAMLSAGFGIQMGLFVQVRRNAKRLRGSAKAQVAATGGTSAVAMVACCLHHLSELLPVLGLSAAAVFLTAYQVPFILLALAANVFGVLMMLSILRRQQYPPAGPLFRFLLSLDLRKARIGFVALAAAIVASSFLLTATKAAAAGGGSETAVRLALEERIDERNGITIRVTPEAFGSGEPLRFKLQFDTHQGSLDFDLATVSVLEDGNGNLLRPHSWDGSPSGGHHRSGVLTFPPLAPETEELRLTLQITQGLPERAFEWTLSE